MDDLLAAFWYVAGLTAVQVSLVRSWQHDDIAVLPRVERQACAEPAEVPAGSPTAPASSRTSSPRATSRKSSPSGSPGR